MRLTHLLIRFGHAVIAGAMLVGSASLSAADNAGRAIPRAASATDDLREVQRLVDSSQRPEALKKLEQLQRRHPDEPQWRFMRAGLLDEAGDTSQAMALYRQLNVDFPELPEPYNNLAVLAAAQGDYDHARQLLEAALRVNPSYAVAQKNLGDVYVELAQRAYARAVSLDPSNARLPARLQALKQLPNANTSR